MTVLRDLYDPTWRAMDDAAIAELDELAYAIRDTPKWRKMRRAFLRSEYREKQRALFYLREAADQATRDRLLREAVRGG